MNGFCDYKNDKKFDAMKKRIYKKRALSVLFAVLSEIAFIVLGFVMAEATAYRPRWAMPVIAALAGLITVYNVFGLRFFFDRDCEGRIVKIEETRKDLSKTTYGQMANNRKKITVISIYVYTDGGKVRVFEATYDSSPEKYYKEGDRVRHYSGLKLLEKEDKSKDRIIICNSCGNYPLIEEPVCPICGNELLK